MRKLKAVALAAMLVAGLVVVSAPPAHAAAFAFGPEVAYSPVGRPFSPEVADVDGDGDLDIITGNLDFTAGVDEVGVLLNNGNGTFSPTTDEVPACDTPSDIVVGNVNVLTDAHPDIVTRCANLTTRTLLGDGTGGFADPVSAVSGGHVANAHLALGQFNSGTALDLFYMSAFGQPALCAAAGEGDGGGSFGGQGCEGYDPGPPAVFGTPIGGEIINVDFDGDGDDMPVVIGTNDDVLLYGFDIALNGGLASPVSRPTHSPGPYSVSLSQGDINNDTIPDVIVLNAGSEEDQNDPNDNILPSFSVFLGTALGIPSGYTPAVVEMDPRMPWVDDSALGDFDGDGKLDLAVVVGAAFDINYLYEGTLAIYRGNGDGTFAGAELFPAGGNGNAEDIRAGDFNGDGADDIVIGTGQTWVDVLLATPITQPTPTLSINHVTKKEGNRGNKIFQFTVGLTPAPTETVTVDFATADGTAKQLKDYQQTSGQLVFHPTDPYKTIDVLVKGDRRVERKERFTVVLSNASGANFANSIGTGTIKNND